jgi:hypothetical protein
MDDATRADVAQYVGSIAGALTYDEYTRNSYRTDAGSRTSRSQRPTAFMPRARSVILRARTQRA